MFIQRSILQFTNQSILNASRLQLTTTLIYSTHKPNKTKNVVDQISILQAVTNGAKGFVRLYKLLAHGTRTLCADFKQYFKIKRSKKDVENLTREEIELVAQMPNDIRNITPFLVIFCLPLVSYFLLPLAHFFPRQLLCRHFWNEQQKAEYNAYFLHNRLLCHMPIIKQFHLELRSIPKSILAKDWCALLELISRGIRPHPDQVLVCKVLFTEKPYALVYLNKDHIKHLLKMHELHMGWFRRTRLGDRAVILQAMDRAIIREGGVEILSADSLRQACLIRGLNPMNMKNEDMVNWLKGWIAVSSEIDKDSLSLLLHCPILLAYNEPTNWQLIYDTKQPKL